MTEPRDEAIEHPAGEHPAGASTVLPLSPPFAEPEPEPAAIPRAANTPPSRRAAPVAVLWLALMLLLVIAAVAAAPFWAPSVVALLPWGGSAGAVPDSAALSGRVGAIEQRLAAASGDAGQVKSALSALSGRVDRLDATRDAAQQAAAERQQLQQRLAALEAKLAAQPAIDPTVLTTMQQDLTRLDSLDADLGNRLAAAEKTIGTAAADETDAALVLALLQIREAVQDARQFPAEYDALIALAGSRPDVVSAAEPLADAAKGGVASRAVLVERLAALAGRIATAAPPPAASDWGARALEQVRGLVTIRRIDGPGQTAPEAAVNAAQLALARGDLAGAVAALAALSGANAEAAAPWLEMARDRLRVEIALERVQQLLVARLGGGPARSPPPAAPPPAGPRS